MHPLCISTFRFQKKANAAINTAAATLSVVPLSSMYYLLLQGAENLGRSSYNIALSATPSSVPSAAVEAAIAEKIMGKDEAELKRMQADIIVKHILEKEYGTKPRRRGSSTE